MARLGYGLEAGTTIGMYRIDAPIGRGGMGVVYEATHVRLNRKVALKVLSPDLPRDTQFRERFIRESQLAAAIDHPNIVPVYDADERDGVLYLAMRHIEGTDLDEVLGRRGSVSPDEALVIVRSAASALDAAHDRGLVHRDVKPGNILLEDGSNRVYLTDFGLAKLTTTTGPTVPGFFLGTLHYSAPEQIEGKPVDARTDVYALGCVLYHCLAGRPPFERDSDIAVLHAHLHAPPPAIREVRPELPALLDDVVATAMAKDPDDRYSSAGSLARAFGDALAGRAGPETVPGHGVTALEPARAESGSAQVSQVDHLARERPLRRLQLALVLLTAAVIGLAALATRYVMSDGAEPSPSPRRSERTWR